VCSPSALKKFPRTRIIAHNSGSKRKLQFLFLPSALVLLLDQLASTKEMSSRSWVPVRSADQASLLVRGQAVARDNLDQAWTLPDQHQLLRTAPVRSWINALGVGLLKRALERGGPLGAGDGVCVAEIEIRATLRLDSFSILHSASGLS